MRGTKAKLLRKAISPDSKKLRERRYLRLGNTIRDNGFRRQYQALKREYKLYGPIPKGEMV